MPQHNHASGCGCAGFADSNSSTSMNPEGSLLSVIDLSKVRCLNERVSGSAKGVFKGLHASERQDASSVLESCEGDTDLLLHVPFLCTVRVTRLCISSAGSNRSPAKCKLFVDKADLDFSSAEAMTSSQQVDLVEDPLAELWHPLKVAKFNNVSSVQLFLTGALQDDIEDVLVSFIGLKGEVTGHISSLPKVVVYESAPRLADHQIPSTNSSSRATIE